MSETRPAGSLACMQSCTARLLWLTGCGGCDEQPGLAGACAGSSGQVLDPKKGTSDWSQRVCHWQAVVDVVSSQGWLLHKHDPQSKDQGLGAPGSQSDDSDAAAAPAFQLEAEQQPCVSCRPWWMW